MGIARTLFGAVRKPRSAPLLLSAVWTSDVPALRRLTHFSADETHNELDRLQNVPAAAVMLGADL